MNGELWIYLPSSTLHKSYSDLGGEEPKCFRVSGLQESTSKDQHTQLNLVGDVTAQDVLYQGPLAYERALNWTKWAERGGVSFDIWERIYTPWLNAKRKCRGPAGMFEGSHVQVEVSGSRPLKRLGQNTTHHARMVNGA